MTMIIALAGVLCLLLAWILVVPVTMVLDSSHDVYCLWQPGTFRVLFIPGNNPRFRFMLFGFELGGSKSQKKSPPGKTRKTSRTYSTSRFELQKLFRAVLRAVTVRRFYFNVDTDSMFWNAILVPVGLRLNDDRTTVLSNYHGDVTLLLDVRIALYKLALPITRFIFKHK